MKRTLLAAVAAALAGCAMAPPPQEQPRPGRPDVVLYHPPRDPRFEIPERFRTAHLQQREQRAQFQQIAGQLHERVQRDPNFGGLILRWVPEPHAVVMFTGDAEARLARYTRDPRFKAQRVELTLAELERMKDGFGEQLAGLGLKCFSVDGDEEHNSVTVGAPPDALGTVRAAIAAGRLKPPPKLRLVEQGCPEFR